MPPLGVVSTFQESHSELTENIDHHQTNHEKLFLISGEGTPFPFKLTANLKAIDEETEGYIHFDGKVNMFLKMMVEKPLTNLFNYMSEKLAEYFTSQK